MEARLCPVCGADHKNEPPCPQPLSAAMRGSNRRLGPIGSWTQDITDEQHRRNRARRERVLRYPDLAEALTEPPLSYSKAEIWNGYIPPRYDADAPAQLLHSFDGKANAKHRHNRPGGTNEAPERAVLVAICQLAWEREVEAGRTPEPERDLIEMFPFPYPGLQRGDRYPKVPEAGTLDDVPAEPPVSADYQHEPMRGRDDDDDGEVRDSHTPSRSGGR